MNRNQLESKLATLGVQSESFSLDCIRNSDCVSVVLDDGKWKVFYTERDKPKELGAFPTDEGAYDFVYQTFCTWLVKAR